MEIYLRFSQDPKPITVVLVLEAIRRTFLQKRLDRTIYGTTKSYRIVEEKDSTRSNQRFENFNLLLCMIILMIGINKHKIGRTRTIPILTKVHVVALPILCLLI